MSAAVKLDGVTARVGARTVWSDVSLTIGEGEFVAILGPNGSGKTTMLRVLLGQLAPAAGSVSVLGAPAGARSREIGYLPQRRHIDAGGPRVRGIDLVRLGLDGARWGLPLPPVLPGALRRSRRASARVNEVLELVGAAAYADRALDELSGGEQQRLFIAQALVSQPRMLVLDEPLDSLDLPNQNAVAALVGRIRRERGVTVLLVAHDVNPLLGELDCVVYLGGGRAACGPTEEVINAQTLSVLYGTPIEVLRASDGRLVVVGLPDAPAHHGHTH